MLQLDQNRIAIRQRNFVDTLDLSLKVIRVHAGPLTLALVAGVLPLALLNAWLLADYREPDFDIGFPLTYMWYMTLLVVWQTPLATAPATLYLGKALFVGRPGVGRIARDCAGSLPQLLFYQVLMRGMLMLPVITLFFPYCMWPYLNEIILLERNPFRAGSANRISTWRRWRTLHARQAGDLFARWLGALAVGGLLLGAIWCSIGVFRGLLLAEWEQAESMFTVCFPLALWVVMGYFCVARFLGYLDLRIAREGWEVELIMRAEHIRLAKELKWDED